MSKKLTLPSAIILSLALFAGCSGGGAPASSSTSEAPAPGGNDTASSSISAAAPENGGKIIVGLDDTFAPMGFRDNANNLVGFDIDLANAVGAEMGVEIVFQPIDWDAKEMELEARKIDCIWNGMSRTPEREASMTLSQNYLNNKIIIMTTADIDVADKAQLKDLQIGTQAKSSALETIKKDDIFPGIEANLFEYRTYDECILDMQAGRIQAMIVDEVLGQYKNSNLEKKFNVASVDFGEDFYVIGFRKDDTALCGQVEAAMKAVIESGKGKEISEKWFGADLLLPLE